MSRAARLLAALLPLAGLSALWGLSASAFREGTEWEVPIMGYDPRDILRGHYVEFTYDWPGRAGWASQGPLALCLEGTPPRLAEARVLEEGAPCAHPLRVNPAGVYGWEALLRGRYYLGQRRAEALDKELRNRDRRGIVTIRQRGDGSFVVTGIRFRPLTPAERAARDTPAEAAGEAPAPEIAPSAPPIMNEAG